MLTLKETRDGISFEVKVAPRASRSAIRAIREGVLVVSLTAPPVDGAANAALCEYLSDVLDVPVRAVEITRGHKSRSKAVRVSGLDAATLLGRIKTAVR